MVNCEKGVKQYHYLVNCDENRKENCDWKSMKYGGWETAFGKLRQNGKLATVNSDSFDILKSIFKNLCFPSPLL